MPDLPFQGVIRLRSIKGSIKIKSPEDIIEYTGAAHGEEESFHNTKEIEYPNSQKTSRR